MRRPGSRDEPFAEYVGRRRGALLGTACALTSGDRHLAEDLVQTALTRLYVAWPRVRADHLDAYVRRVLVNSMVDHTRRPSRREVSRPELPDRSDDHDTGAESVDADVLGALARLPVRMRTAVVLRHVEGLSVEETAHAMRCSTGNVKSQTARGLEKLRHHLRAQEDSWTS